MTDTYDAELAISNKTDPFGKRWTCKAMHGYGLYTVGTLNDRDEFSVPQTYPKGSGLDGKFTKVVLAESQINAYLKKAWEYSDKQAVKKNRTEHATKVAAKEERVATD